MKKLKLNQLITLVFLFLIPYSIYAKTNKNTVNIYFFHSDTCSHCKEENQILKEIENLYENVSIYRYEMHDEKNKIILNEVKNTYNISTTGVPITIIGNQIYTGFSKEKSTIKFIKSIEYYSKYTYEDKVMKIINPNYISNYHESPYIYRESFKKFTKQYKNYNLLGLRTDDLTPSITAIILGVLSEINIITVISIILVFIVLSKIGGEKNKILLLAFYLCCTILLKINSVVKNNYITLAIDIILLTIFMINIFKYYKTKKRQNIAIDIFIILSIIEEYFTTIINNKYILILKDIATLNLLSGLDKIYYYANYLMCIILFNITFILIVYLFQEKKLIKK